MRFVGATGGRPPFMRRKFGNGRPPGAPAGRGTNRSGMLGGERATAGRPYGRMRAGARVSRKPANAGIHRAGDRRSPLRPNARSGQPVGAAGERWSRFELNVVRRRPTSAPLFHIQTRHFPTPHPSPSSSCPKPLLPSRPTHRPCPTPRIPLRSPSPGPIPAAAQECRRTLKPLSGLRCSGRAP